MSCEVCLEDFKGRIKPITCQYCPSSSCRKCLETYLLQTYEDPHCLSCKRGWTPEFMAANFTLTFRGTDLRKHRRNILFEREKSFLPSMQVYVEARKEIETANNKIVELNKGYIGPGSLTERFSEYYRIYSSKRSVYVTRKLQIDNTKNAIKQVELNRAGHTPAIVAEIVRQSTVTLNNYRAMRDALKEELNAFKDENAELLVQHAERTDAINECYSRARQATAIFEGHEAPARREFIMKCGADECRGFLSSAYKCGTCDIWTCPDCLVIIGKDKTVAHECKPDMVESAKTIRSETQPCPKCAARIFKIDGCDQMWCTVDGCNTAFSWKSGRVVTGNVHNPHYYEWLRRNGAAPAREAGDIPCGGLPNYWTLLNALRNADVPAEESVQLENIHRNLVEFEQRLEAYPARMPQLLNKEMNVQYLMNRVTEAEWKRQLEFTEAKFNRKKEIGQILHTLVTASADIMNQLQARCVAAVNEDLQATFRIWMMETALPQLNGLRDYTNQAFKDLAVRNHMAVPQITDDWTWVPIRALYRKKKDEPPPLDTEAQDLGV